MGFIKSLAHGVGSVAGNVISGIHGGIGDSLDNQFQAQGATLQTPITTDQYAAENAAAQQGLAQQQAFVNALQGQNGLGNQASVFAQQQGLANQLGLQAQGLGPNPALAQLNQQTGNNIASQAALMAGQRGVGANPGLISRQIGMQGAGIQQQAIGQSAIQQAQQQLAAQQQLQNQQAQMAGLANTQVNQQAGGMENYNQLLQAQRNATLGGIQSQNQANLSNVQNTNAINANVASGNQSAVNSAIGGITGGIANAAMAAGTGGASKAAAPQAAYSGGEIKGPKSFVGQHFACGGMSYKQGGPVAGHAKVMGDSPKNDTVPAVLSPGEVVIPRSVMQSKDPVKGAAEFVRQVMARKKK